MLVLQLCTLTEQESLQTQNYMTQFNTWLLRRVKARVYLAQHDLNVLDKYAGIIN